MGTRRKEHNPDAGVQTADPPQRDPIATPGSVVHAARQDGERLSWLEIQQDVLAGFVGSLLLLIGVALYVGVAYFGFYAEVEAPTAACAIFGGVAFTGSHRLFRRIVRRCMLRYRKRRRSQAIEDLG